MLAARRSNSPLTPCYKPLDGAFAAYDHCRHLSAIIPIIVGVVTAVLFRLDVACCENANFVIWNWGSCSGPVDDRVLARDATILHATCHLVRTIAFFQCSAAVLSNRRSTAGVIVRRMHCLRTTSPEFFCEEWS